MKYIDHHAHMVSRTTDDYQQMALTGCVAVTEPAFWAGWDRSTAEGVDDYFRQLTDFEPRRAAQYRIQHYAWVGMNPKESDNRELSRQVLQRMPAFLEHPTVLGIGEIGLNRVTRNEIATYTEQIEMAAERRELVLIHTPHLEDKHKGTRISVDVLRRYPELKPSRVLVDHAEEHTIEAILEHGYWAGSDTVSADKDFTATGRRRHRAVRSGSDPGGRRLRLGPERSDCRAALRDGNAAAQASGSLHPSGDLREPGEVSLSQSPKFVLPAGVSDDVAARVG